LSRFSDNLTDTVTVQLTAVSGGRFDVIGNAAILRRPRQERDLRAIASSLNAGFIILGQVQRDQQRVRVLAHLIRMPEQTHITVSRTDDVPEATLAEADEIATKIARAFGRTLGDPARRNAPPYPPAQRADRAGLPHSHFSGWRSPPPFRRIARMTPPSRRRFLQLTAAAVPAAALRGRTVTASAAVTDAFPSQPRELVE